MELEVSNLLELFPSFYYPINSRDNADCTAIELHLWGVCIYMKKGVELSGREADNERGFGGGWMGG